MFDTITVPTADTLAALTDAAELRALRDAVTTRQRLHIPTACLLLAENDI